MISANNIRSFLLKSCPILFLILTSCGEPPQNPLRIGSSPWPGYEPLYLARDLGYFDEEKVSLFELPSSDITLESFRNHSTDIATLTLDEVVGLLNDGTKLRILIALDISDGADAVLARPEIKTLGDIKNKKISIVNITLGLYMLKRTLDFAGVDRSEVEIFPMSESKQEKFYMDNNADVIITFEPVKTNLINNGAHVLFDSSKIPDEIFDLLVVHEDVYQQRKDELCNVVKGWFKSLDYINSNPDDAAQRITKRLGVEKSDFKFMMDGLKLGNASLNKKILSGNSPSILEPSSNLIGIMLKEKMIKNKVDINMAIDTSFSSCY